MTGSTSSGLVSSAPSMRAQVLVIGSGVGGATTAALLAEAGFDVLIVEEGPWVDQHTVTPAHRLQGAPPLVGFFQGRGGDPARMIRMLDILPADTPPTPGAVRSPSLDESLDAAREARIVRERSEEPEALAVEARVRDAIRLDAELRAGLHQPPVDYPVPTTRGLVIYCACMLAFIIFLSR